MTTTDNHLFATFRDSTGATFEIDITYWSGFSGGTPDDYLRAMGNSFTFISSRYGPAGSVGPVVTPPVGVMGSGCLISMLTLGLVH